MDNDKWQEFFSSNIKSNIKRVFIKVMTSDGKHWFFHDYNIWFEIKAHCEKNDLFIKDLHLQFRSHKCILDVEDSEAVYLVRSVLGGMGIETKHYFTFGVLRDGIVYKQMWLTPELLLDKRYEDTLENCFKEAIIYDKKKKNREKQIQA